MNEYTLRPCACKECLIIETISTSSSSNNIDLLLDNSRSLSCCNISLDSDNEYHKRETETGIKRIIH